MDNVGVKTRIAWVDYAKAICIWFMVSCHAGQQGMLNHLIYQFHMPAFFIISGILFRPKGLKKTLLSFGIPIILFGFINLLYALGHSFLHNHYQLIEWRGIITSWFTSFLFESEVDVFKGYWFVLVLLLMRIIFEIKLLRKQNTKVFLAGLAALWCCIEPYWGLSSFVSHCEVWHIIPSLPFFVLGMIIAERKWNIMRGPFELKLLLFLLFIVLTLIQGKVDLAGYKYGYSYLLFFFNAVLGSYLLFNISALAPANRKWLTSISNGTLLVLGLHGLIYVPINLVFHSILGVYNTYLPLLVGLIVLAVCFPIIKCLEKYCPIVLGKVH